MNSESSFECVETLSSSQDMTEDEFAFLYNKYSLLFFYKQLTSCFVPALPLP